MVDQEHGDINHINITNISQQPSHKIQPNFTLKQFLFCSWSSGKWFRFMIHYHEHIQYSCRAENSKQFKSDNISHLTIHHQIVARRVMEKLERISKPKSYKMSWVKTSHYRPPALIRVENRLDSTYNYNWVDGKKPLTDCHRWITREKIRVFLYIEYWVFTE